MVSPNGFHPRLTALPLDPGVERVGMVVSQLSRTHYFDGRLLTAADLVRDQTWLDGRLREVGRAQGDGVVRGLETTLTGAVVSVEPGVAVTPLGRVIELDETLVVDLGDRTTMQQVNGGKALALETGLYAVVLAYAEFEEGLAEVFPAELGVARTTQADHVVEGVELLLVKLPEALPDRRDGPSARAAIAAALLARAGRHPGIPEDGVVLGVLAVRGDAPRWLDDELLRHPLRIAGDPAAFAQDLARHWAGLFPELRATRPTSGVGAGFAAADFVELLPAAGPAPKGAFDPVTGVQRFFPAAFDVAIAPVRSDELAVLLAESRDLAPLEVARGVPASVLVVARLPPELFAQLAPALERRDGKPDETELAHRQFDRFEPLRLRFGRTPIHALDTDREAWQAIWNAIGEEDVYFVRRPARATTVGVSGLVLARGSVVPPRNDPSTATDPASGSDAAPSVPPSSGGSSGTGGGLFDFGRINLSDLRGVSDAFGLSRFRSEKLVEVNLSTSPSSSASTTPATTPTTPPSTSTTPVDPAPAEPARKGASIDVLDSFSRARKPTTPEGERSLDELTKLLEGDEKSAARLASLFAQVDRSFDAALWPTLEELVRNDRLAEFVERLEKLGRAPTGKDLASIVSAMKLSRTTQKLWA